MKINALIADDRQPDGWTECYTATTHDATADQCRAQVQRLVFLYNSDLHALPRRLLSIAIEPLRDDEAFNMGIEAFNKDKGTEDNYFPAGHELHQAWLDGYHEAEEAFVSNNAEGDDDE